MAIKFSTIKKLLQSNFMELFFEKKNNPKSKSWSVVNIKNLTSQKKSNNKKGSKINLEDTVSAQKQLHSIQENLYTIIDTMGQNPSFFNQASLYFGHLALWKKIALGLILSLPTLIIGIFAHIGFLLVITGVILAVYTAAAVILEDHYTNNANNVEQLKTGIGNLSDFLQSIIHTLDVLRLKLAAEMEKFKIENNKLALYVTDLNTHIKDLDFQIKLSKETEQIARATQEKLEHTVADLNNAIENQSTILEKTQTELQTITARYKQTEIQLSEKIQELHKVKIDMAEEIEKIHTNAKLLQELVITLSKASIPGSQQDEFRKRLEEFFADKEKSFHELVKRFGAAEKELVLVKNELNLVKDQLFLCLEGQNTILADQKALCADHKILLTQQSMQLERIKEMPPACLALMPPLRDASVNSFTNISFFPPQRLQLEPPSMETKRAKMNKFENS